MVSADLIAPNTARGRWWRPLPDGRVECRLCPRFCKLRDGQRGFCFVRRNQGGEIVLTTYGRSTGFCIDPIEKKPLNHFLPGTAVLSFGTAGCNLGCRFCQNWDISKSREVAILSSRAGPDSIVRAAADSGCRSIAFTYNDPVVFAEYAIDTARAAREAGIRTVAVTAGYITPEARAEFFRDIDAANVDLKAFTDRFYRRLTLARIAPVLDTLEWLHRETDVWVELTNLVIPGENDSRGEIDRLCDWVLDHLGDEVPLHFTAFHPDFRMLDHPHTPATTLVRAREQAIKRGLKHVYVGNLSGRRREESTICPGCGTVLVERDRYRIGRYAIRDGACAACGTPIAGVFENECGRWGARRQPLAIEDPP
jgi:pyruvate formate lyase activating enzyme